MALSMKQDEAAHPIHISLLSANAVMLHANVVAQWVQQPGWPSNGSKQSIQRLAQPPNFRLACMTEQGPWCMRARGVTLRQTTTMGNIVVYL